MSPLPDSNLPEQTGERMRGGAVPTAVAASTGARRAAAGAHRLPLPGQELLHRGEVPRPRRVEKFLLLPHGESHGIQRGRGEEKRKRGSWVSGVEFLFSLFSLSLSPPAPDLKLFLSAAGAVARKQKLPPPAGCVPPDPRCRWRWRTGESFFEHHDTAAAAATTTEQTSSDQSRESRPSLPRNCRPPHLQSKIGQTPHARTHSRRHTTHNSLYPRLSCFTEKVDGLSKMASIFRKGMPIQCMPC